MFNARFMKVSFDYYNIFLSGTLLEQKNKDCTPQIRSYVITVYLVQHLKATDKKRKKSTLSTIICTSIK